MLTLFYVSSTFLQSWRINQVSRKISEQLAQKASIAFYTLPSKSEEGFDIAFATSPLCTNRKVAKVSEILWLLNDQRGCTLRPVQMVNVTPWITFPAPPSLLPFAYVESPTELKEHLIKRKDIVHLLLETDLQPSSLSKRGNLSEIVQVENYGKLVAWKVDSKLAIIIETDVENFTKLLIATFLRSNFLINDELPLLRIESIYKEGQPQPFELLLKHLKKPERKAKKLISEEWKKHLEGLRAINVLASQAMEFEFNKNRTDAKPGGIKPDLIPQKDQHSVTAPNLKKEEAPKLGSKNSLEGNPEESPKKTTPALIEIKMKTEASLSQKTENLIEAEKASPPNKSNNDDKKNVAEKQIPKSSEESRFKTTKVKEQSPLKSITPTSTTKSILRRLSPSKSTDKPSELEKLAAVTLAAQKSSNSNAIVPASSSDVTPISSKSPLRSSVATVSSAAASPIKPATPLADTTTEVNLEKPSTSAKPLPPKQNTTKRPSLKRSKDGVLESKPLNILVYSDSRSSRDSAVNTLRKIVEPNMYTIYPLTPQQVEDKHWVENTALVVVCGYVISNIGEILVDYFLHGGKVLSLCSDILHFILPTYRTAEVREHELVQFSYDKWQKVKMMHHIFCYQPSPVRKHFSTDSEEANQTNSKKSALVCPRLIELKDMHGRSHSLDVQVLGSEETWNSPSLLLAKNHQSGGKALFSQIHLETSPNQFEMDEIKYPILKENESIRLDIFSDLLKKYLNIHIKEKNNPADSCVFKPAYFLGKHEAKFELLDKLKPQLGAGNILNTPKLKIHLCGKNEFAYPDETMLPLYIHSCPEDFSTVDYFDNLKTNYIGRLVIYAPIVNSTMNVINHLELTDGIAVITRQQTEGQGRSKNQWLSPLGCAMFSIQLHISLDTPLGSRLPLLQHIVGLAMVNTIKSHDKYKVLDIGLKWPNDVYANGLNKIGGLIVQTTLQGNSAIANIGCAFNLDNSKPTTCLNDLISDFNSEKHQTLPKLNFEQFLALIFNEIERLVEQVQKGNSEDFYKLYYDLWLHNNQTVSITDNNGHVKEATVVGIDDFGFLKVELTNGSIESVQPDGNTFDMLKGLIVPKFF